MIVNNTDQFVRIWWGKDYLIEPRGTLSSKASGLDPLAEKAAISNLNGELSVAEELSEAKKEPEKKEAVKK